MKKIRIFSLILSLLVLLTLLSPAAFCETQASTEAPTTAQTTEQIQTTQTTEQTQTTQTDVPDPEALTPDSQKLPELRVLPSAPEYTVDAKAAILIELNSGTIVYALNPDERAYPASLTKIMTCMLALDYGNLDDVLTVSETALQGLDEAGSTAGLVAGEQITLRNVLYCMMLSSANEACNVVAEYISGSVEDFVALMNKKAAALGCTGTHFANPHGLHEENHYTTARDLSTITRKALENQTFREITSTATYTVPATNKSEARNLTSTNFLISTATVQEYYYPNASGIKTGYTSAAGRCLISTASDGNLKFLSVVLGAQTEMREDGSVQYDNFIETAKLFDYGFDNFTYVQVLTRLQPTAQVPVAFSSGADSVVLIPSEDISCLLPKDYDKNQVTTQYTLDDANGLEAPLTQGQKVGTVTVSYNGSAIGSTTIETLTAVERSELERTFHETKTFAQTYWWVFLLLILLVLVILTAVLVHVRAEKKRRRAAMRARRPGAQNRRTRP